MVPKWDPPSLTPAQAQGRLVVGAFVWWGILLLPFLAAYFGK